MKTMRQDESLQFVPGWFPPNSQLTNSSITFGNVMLADQLATVIYLLIYSFCVYSCILFKLISQVTAFYSYALKRLYFNYCCSRLQQLGTVSVVFCSFSKTSIIAFNLLTVARNIFLGFCPTYFSMYAQTLSCVCIRNCVLLYIFQ